MNETILEKKHLQICFGCHSCTIHSKHMDNEWMEPLNKDTLMLASCIRDSTGYCSVTGSAPLAQLRTSEPFCSKCLCNENLKRVLRRKWKPGDIDFFVPMYPKTINFFQGKEPTFLPARNNKPFNELFFGDILPQFKKFFMTQKHIDCTYREYMGPFHYDYRDHEESDEENDEESDDEIRDDSFHEYSYYQYLKLFCGLRGCIQVKMWNDKDCEPSIINIMLRDVIPEPSHSWNEIATKDFDIDICQIYADSFYQEDFKPRIAFVSLSSYFSFLSGSFRMTIRPCEPFPLILTRMEKYRDRGFTCSAIVFHEYLTKEWKQYIIDSFRDHYGYKWLEKMLGEVTKKAPNFNIDEFNEKGPIYKNIISYAVPTYGKKKMKRLARQQMNYLDQIRDVKRNTQI